MTCSFSLSDEKSLRHEQNHNPQSHLLSSLQALLSFFNMLVILSPIKFSSQRVTWIILSLSHYCFTVTFSVRPFLTKSWWPTPSLLPQHAFLLCFPPLYLSLSSKLNTYILLIYLFVLFLPLLERSTSLLFLFFTVSPGPKTGLALRSTQQRLVE